ncbi:MAG: helix-turn-helix domain-containing protein [Planctomycetia bacterium]|nr:helix-turn-helix domain-containing protein [Planctomycetia bacterium]
MDLLGLNSCFRLLDNRRRELGMSYAALAKRSGVSMSTVVRILSGNHPDASFRNVAGIADALGVHINFAGTVTVQKLRQKQAQEKARQLVGFVQGTSGLEGQAVGNGVLAEMTQDATVELLAGSKRKLWSD